jgi:hypothetical protein
MRLVMRLKAVRCSGGSLLTVRRLTTAVLAAGLLFSCSNGADRGLNAAPTSMAPPTGSSLESASVPDSLRAHRGNLTLASVGVSFGQEAPCVR